MIGSLANSPSQTTARAMTTSEPPSRAKLVAEAHSNWLPPRETQISSAETPAMISSEPT